MSDQIDLATASQLFDTEVTLRYQNYQYLRGCVTERHGTTGDATNVPISSLIEMNDQTFAPSNIPVTPVDNTNQIVVPVNYALKTVIGGGEKTLFAYDKIVDHAKDHALAAGRQLDYVVIQSLINDAAYSSLYTVPVTVGVNTGMNEGKIADALSYLEDQGVDVQGMQCSLWMPALTKKALLQDQQVTNIFYNDKKPLVDNVVTSYLGVDIRTLGSNGKNAIPRTGAGTTLSPYNYLVPLVHRDAIVQIFNRDVQTSITWVPQNDRWELLTVVTTGAKLVKSNGVALITAQSPFADNP